MSVTLAPALGSLLLVACDQCGGWTLIEDEAVATGFAEQHDATCRAGEVR